MMATDDVGCTAKSITTCNNLSWSSVSLCWGEESPREILHCVQVPSLTRSLCPCEYLAVSYNPQGFFAAWQGYLTHSCHPSYFPGSTNQICLCPFQLLCHWCSICRLSKLFLLGLPCPCDIRRGSWWDNPSSSPTSQLENEPGSKTATLILQVIIWLLEEMVARVLLTSALNPSNLSNHESVTSVCCSRSMRSVGQRQTLDVLMKSGGWV